MARRWTNHLPWADMRFSTGWARARSLWPLRAVQPEASLAWRRGVLVFPYAGALRLEAVHPLTIRATGLAVSRYPRTAS